MQKTTNYQLNQWEKADRILMDDFNRDNANIEAVLAANAAAVSAEEAARAASLTAEETARKAADTTLQSGIIATNPIVRLADVTTASAASQVNLYIGNINWTAYGEVLLFARLKCKDAVGGLTLTLDGDTGSGSYFCNTYSGYGTQAYLQTATIYPQESALSARIPFTRCGFVMEWSGAPDTTYSGSPIYGVSYCYNTSKLRTQYSNLNFTCSAPLNAGCRLVLLGVKL